MVEEGPYGWRWKAALPDTDRAEAIPLITEVLLNLFKDQLAGLLLIFAITGAFL